MRRHVSLADCAVAPLLLSAAWADPISNRYPLLRGRWRARLSPARWRRHDCRHLLPPGLSERDCARALRRQRRRAA
jgi:hypothetical protein